MYKSHIEINTRLFYQMNNKNGGCIEGLMSKEGHNCVEIGQNINHY